MHDPIQDKSTMHVAVLWSIAITAALLIYVVGQWYKEDRGYQPNINQLLSYEESFSDLLLKLKQTHQYSPTGITYIPVGIWIQSFAFSGSNQVDVSGYLWEHHVQPELPMVATGSGVEGDEALENCAANIPNHKKGNFVLVEAVNDGANVLSDLMYCDRSGAEVVLGWYFEATLRQPFNYRKFPIDHKTVWLRLWPRDFSSNIYPVPALFDFRSTRPGITFGRDSDLVLENWVLQETFFDYKLKQYDTSFGFKSFRPGTTHPELHFNIVLKRKFLNAFVLHLVPLVTVAFLLFAVLLTLTKNEAARDVAGFSLGGVIGMISGLFFVVLLAHIQLRERFAASGIVYIEYYYLLMYVLMLLVTLNAFMISLNSQSPFLQLLIYRDNAPAKLLYWPFSLAVIAVTTSIILG